MSSTPFLLPLLLLLMLIVAATVAVISHLSDPTPHPSPLGQYHSQTEHLFTFVLYNTPAPRVIKESLLLVVKPAVFISDIYLS